MWSWWVFFFFFFVKWLLSQGLSLGNCLLVRWNGYWWLRVTDCASVVSIWGGGGVSSYMKLGRICTLCTHSHLCVCGRTSCSGPLDAPQGQAIFSPLVFLSQSLPRSGWEPLLAGWERPTAGICCLRVWPPRLSDNHIWEDTNGWRHQRWLAC